MTLMLECYDHEKQAAMDALGRSFRVKSVSKPYPNTRQTGAPGTPCESRHYIKLEDPPIRQDAALRDMMTKDMMRFLSLMAELHGLDAEAEMSKLRSFYLASGNLTDAQGFELLAEWRASLLLRCADGAKGGGNDGTGDRRDPRDT